MANGYDKFFPDEIAAISARSKFLETSLDLFTRNLGFNDFCQELLKSVVDVTNSEAGSILEVNYRDQTIFFRSAVGYGAEQVVKFVIPMGQGIVGHVVESRLPFHMSNVEENKEHLASVSHAVGFVVRNMVAVPVVIRGKVFGVVELLNRIGEPDFSQEDLAEVNHICGCAAKVIEVRLMLGWTAQKSSKPGEAA